MDRKRAIWEVLESRHPGNWFDTFIITLISLNLLVFVLETDKRLEAEYGIWFHRFDAVSVGIFTIEFLARIYSCPASPRFDVPRGRLKYIFSLYGMVDLLSILPFYLHLLFTYFSFDARFLRILRILRFLKGFRYSRSLQRLAHIFVQRAHELFSSLIVMLSLLFVTSTLMYYAEHEAQPDKFGSIFEAMWWSVATLTTVGYGDVTPITGLGRVLGSISAILGIGLFAIPAGILAAGFAETRNPSPQPEPKDPEIRYCKYCGKPID